MTSASGTSAVENFPMNLGIAAKAFTKAHNAAKAATKKMKASKAAAMAAHKSFVSGAISHYNSGNF